MKASISITLIVMGALLIMTPAVSDYFYQAHLVTLMKPPGITSVNLDGKMHSLEVKVAGAGLNVRARKNYLARAVR